MLIRQHTSKWHGRKQQSYLMLSYDLTVCYLTNSNKEQLKRKKYSQKVLCTGLQHGNEL